MTRRLRDPSRYRGTIARPVGGLPSPAARAVASAIVAAAEPDAPLAVPNVLADLTDVDGAAPTDGQVLVWDAVNGWWEPGTIAAGSLDSLTDVTITSPADLQRLHYNATSGQWVNTSAIWRPLMDGAGNVITDGVTGEAIMALG